MSAEAGTAVVVVEESEAKIPAEAGTSPKAKMPAEAGTAVVVVEESEAKMPAEARTVVVAEASVGHPKFHSLQHHLRVSSGHSSASNTDSKH